MCICSVFMYTIINFMHICVHMTAVSKCRIQAWFAVAVRTWQILHECLSASMQNGLEPWCLFLWVWLVFNSKIACAKVHIIHITIWVITCLLIPPWCNCFKLPTVQTSHYKLPARLWNIAVPAVKLPLTPTAFGVILPFVPVSYLAWRSSY